MDNLVEIFCDADDFCRIFLPEREKRLIETGKRQRQRKGRMHSAEIMTLIILFYRSNHRNFKNFYISYVSRDLNGAFPSLPGYTRFLEVMPRVLVPLCGYFTHLKGKPTGIAFIDSTSLKSCHNLKIPRHRKPADRQPSHPLFRLIYGLENTAARLIARNQRKMLRWECSRKLTSTAISSFSCSSILSFSRACARVNPERKRIL